MLVFRRVIDGGRCSRVSECWFEGQATASDEAQLSEARLGQSSAAASAFTLHRG
jgi:hypothetical protein